MSTAPAPPPNGCMPVPEPAANLAGLVPEQSEAWLQAMKMTADMYQLAADDEWERLTELEAARRLQLEKVFAHPVAPEAAEAVADGVRRILAIDREIMEKGRLAREDYATRLGDLANGRRANNAYQKHV